MLHATVPAALCKSYKRILAHNHWMLPYFCTMEKNERMTQSKLKRWNVIQMFSAKCGLIFFIWCSVTNFNEIGQQQKISKKWDLDNVYLPITGGKKYTNFNGQKCKNNDVWNEHQKYFIHSWFGQHHQQYCTSQAFNSPFATKSGRKTRSGKWIDKKIDE